VNLEKLFETQKELDNKIPYSEYDRLDKKLVALVVEVSEWANENRWFKFWSKDQTPRTRKSRTPYMDIDDADFYNPSLEELVDGWHFIFSIGNEIEFDCYEWQLEPVKERDLTYQFMKINQCITDLWEDTSAHTYANLFEHYLGLTKMLGFTWEEVEQAYFTKNAINHQRQESGY
jgi:dimeric dUTPase (all-alpha-NTP-PPase superfamily)